jgi:ribonucleoside-diphosphate reductase subunit M1
MKVTKRGGEQEPVDIGKVVRRIERLCEAKGGLPALPLVDVQGLAIKVVQSIHEGIPTSELDEVTAEIAQPLAVENPQYGDLAARVLVNNYHKNTLHALWTHFQQKRSEYGRQPPATIDLLEGQLFYWTARALWENTDPHGEPNPLISPVVFAAACEGSPDRWVNYERDYQYDFAGFQLLESTYLLEATLLDGDGKPYRRHIERPQHLLLRVALGVHAMPTSSLRNGGREDHISHEGECGADFPWDGYHGPKEPAVAAPLLTRGVLAGGVAPTSLARAAESYDLLSRLLFTHATPTLFHAGTMHPQMSSCYLLQPGEDSLDAIYDFAKECAGISKWAGGIGSHIHLLRGHGAYIRGTHGRTNGIPRMLRVLDATSVYVDQSGKRPGTHAVFLSVSHPDIMEFIEMKQPRTNELERAKNLFYGLWVPDEFMRCVKMEREWHLICPNAFRARYGRELEDLFDEDPSVKWLDAPSPERHAYTHAHRKAVAEGVAVRSLPALKLWRRVLEVLQETGGPYICFSGNVNRKSNHRHLGTVKSSNLCTEIMEFSSPAETAVCNLASICLPKFIRCTRTTSAIQGKRKEDAGAIAFGEKAHHPHAHDVAMLGTMGPQPHDERIAFGNVINESANVIENGDTTILSASESIIDWELLRTVVRTCVSNLDRIIDRNFYPNEKTVRSNMRHRPIGIGVQGLADLFCLAGLPFNSEGARRLEFALFERMSFWATERSCELAQERGAHERCKESPLGQGIFQWQLWEEEQGKLGRSALSYPLSMDWDLLRASVRAHGVRNSLLLALMPTASTSTVMGMSPCFEPYSSLVFKRRNRTGETTCVNRHFIEHMLRLGLWTPQLRAKVLRDHRGSVADTALPAEIKALYQTVWDLPPDCLTKASAVRAPFICQSQSLNQFMERPTPVLLNSNLFFAWSRGLKTASYYTRRLAPVDAQKIQLDTEELNSGEACTMKDGCVSCGS